ncbi:MAG: heme exporter protein CcmB [Desulfovibrionaceae bacterium]|nr:heme exporter protein CcmB [Desulfovibrionaceae bacterium]
MPSPLKFLIALFAKDLSILGLKGGALAQALLLGLVLIFLFSLAQEPGQTLSLQNAACVFWLSSLFGQVLIFNQLYALEEQQATRTCLLLLPFSITWVYLAKTLTGLCLLLISQSLFLPASLIFLGQSLPAHSLALILYILIIDLGICALGSLLGALAQGQAARESLLSILLFPLLTPLLLAGISLHTQAYSPTTSNWLSLALAFDAIFFSVCLWLFPFIYTDEA